MFSLVSRSLPMLPSLALVVSSLYISHAWAYDDTCNSNLVTYWGQNSYGARHTDAANFQKRLSYYCDDDTINVFPIAFMNVFSSTGGLPQINLANTCNSVDQSFFPGSQLLDCSFLAQDIKTCQAKGKLVTLSMGGETGGGAADAAFADQVWNLFLGGSSSTRPFGDAVLDGVDLDIEGGSNSYVTFVNQLRTHFSGASKKYYVTAAPQCPFPDAALGASLNNAYFDAIYIQFYNNACGAAYYGTTAWNFGTWDYWARRVSPNKNIKVFIGVPASDTAAGSSYVSLATLGNIAHSTRASFPSFGGLMTWDESQAYANGRYDIGMKNILKDGGSCGNAFVYPACTAPTWSASGNYPAGSQVTYDGYIWQARWYGSGAPSPSDTGSWVPISACGGGSTPPATSTTSKAVTTSTSKAVTTTTSKPVTPPTTTSKAVTTTSAASGGSCAGVSAWSATGTYTSSQTATYNGHLWQASWWTYGDIPGGAAGVWKDLGACTSFAAAVGNHAVDKHEATPTATASLQASATTSPSSDCASAAAWSSKTGYASGKEVAYGGIIWQAKWWTQADTPGGNAQAWRNIKSCASEEKTTDKRSRFLPHL